jgi:hypothetical protein
MTFRLTFSIPLKDEAAELEGIHRDLNMPATNITSKCRIASMELDYAMILAHVANPNGSNYRQYRSCLLPGRGALEAV